MKKLILLTYATATLSACVTSSTTSDIASKNGEYISHKNGTVTDEKAGLMWKQCSEGQVLKNCKGVLEKYTWNDAVEKFKKISFSGYNDWRLPTKEEMKTLVHCGNGKSQEEAWKSSCILNGNANHKKPTINTQIFPNTFVAGYFWTASSVINSKNNAWIITYFNGSGSWGAKEGKHSIRLVRSIK